MHTGDVDTEQLSIQLSVLTALLQVFTTIQWKNTHRSGVMVMKEATAMDLLAAQGRGSQAFFSEDDRNVMVLKSDAERLHLASFTQQRPGSRSPDTWMSKKLRL